MTDDVLAVLRRGPALVSDIMAATGRSNSSVYNVLAELQWHGLVVARPSAADRAKRRPGRPRNVYALATCNMPAAPAPGDELVDELFALHVG